MVVVLVGLMGWSGAGCVRIYCKGAPASERDPRAVVPIFPDDP